MHELGGDEPLELGYELMYTFRREIELEDFDCDEAIASRFVRTEDRSQHPCTDLMKNTKWTERVRGAGGVLVQ